MATLSNWAALPLEIRNRAIDAGLRSRTWPAGFPAMIRANRHILEAVISEVRLLRAAGRDHYSMRTILEFIRHSTAVTQEGGEWKINNNIQRPLTLLMIELFPEVDGFFHTRTRRVRKAA